MTVSTVQIPPLVRIKPGALARLGVYLARNKHTQPLILASAGLPESVLSIFRPALESVSSVALSLHEVVEGSFEAATSLFTEASTSVDCVVGLGGGRAIDVAKYVAFLLRKPFYSVPTSLSHDGFCSPQSSLTMKGARRSLPSTLPFGVVIDTGVCLQAPRELWHSGIGDLSAKITAIADWKLAFHNVGTPIHDLAALLSDASVMQFIARPVLDLDGIKLLATALMLNGISIELAGSSRPASGSEHLVSHALDVVSTRPRLHGLQVGVATYLMSRLQGGSHSDLLSQLFVKTGFWDTIKADPFSRTDWQKALTLAPSVKEDFYTILSHSPYLDEAMRLIELDPFLNPCFVE